MVINSYFKPKCKVQPPKMHRKTLPLSFDCTAFPFPLLIHIAPPIIEASDKSQGSLLSPRHRSSYSVLSESKPKLRSSLNLWPPSTGFRAGNTTISRGQSELCQEHYTVLSLRYYGPRKLILWQTYKAHHLQVIKRVQTDDRDKQKDERIRPYSIFLQQFAS